MPRQGIRLAAFLVIASFLALWSAAPAEAHKRLAPEPSVVDAPADPLPAALPDEPPLAWKSAPTGPSAPWAVLLALAVATVVATRRPRRALALALAVVLALFAFETGVHSVHHLNEPRPASCAIAFASQHEAGTLTDSVGVEQARAVAGPAPHLAEPRTLVIRWLGPHTGRSPPSRPA